MLRLSRLIPLLALPLILGSLQPPDLVAQERNLSFVTLVTPLPGHRANFVEGMAEYLEDYREDGVGTAYSVWEVITSEHSGSFYVIRSDKSWSTIGSPPNDPERLQSSLEENLDPHIARSHGSVWRTREDLGYRTDQSREPGTMIQSQYVRVHPSDFSTFEGSWLEVKEAAEEEAFSHAWSIAQPTNGGGGITYRAQIEGSDLADFEDPDPTLAEVLVANMGERGMERVYWEYAGTVVEKWSEMMVLRAGLSFLPEG